MSKMNPTIREWMTLDKAEMIVCDEEAAALVHFYGFVIRGSMEHPDTWSREWCEPTRNGRFNSFYNEYLDYALDKSRVNNRLENLPYIKKEIAVAKTMAHMLTACQIFFHDGMTSIFERGVEEFDTFLASLRAKYEKGESIDFFPFFPIVIERAEPLENYKLAWLTDVLESYRSFM